MVQYAITTEEQLTFDYAFNMYCELGTNITKIIPWVDAPVALGDKFYYPVRPAQPAVGKIFDYEKQAEIQYTELTSNSAGIWLDLEVPDIDRRILSRTGMNVESAWAKIAAQQLMQQVAHVIYMGDTVTEFSGLFTLAGHTSTYTTVKWNAATGPHLAANDMIYGTTALWDSNFRPPYVCVLSSNLAPGLNVTINAAPVSDITNGDVLLRWINGNKSGDTGNLFWELIGTNSPDDAMIYPIETATTNDGRALIMKPVQDGTNYVEGVWMQRPHSTDWTFDAKTDRWHTRIKAMIALHVLDAFAVAGHTTVDLA